MVQILISKDPAEQILVTLDHKSLLGKIERLWIWEKNIKSIFYLLVVLTIWVTSIALNDASAQCNLLHESNFTHDEIGTISISRDPQTKALVFTSQMQVNTDGAPDSYHPEDIGITHICNGVSVGANCVWKANCLVDFNKAKAEDFNGPTKICFFAMATQQNGKPIIQTPNDPKPGYFVSTTALQQPGVDRNTPQAQLDSNHIPFIVIPRPWQQSATPGVNLGDFAVVLRKSTGQISFAIVGDLGPKRKLGEGSVALHQALGNDPFHIRFGKRRACQGIGGRDVMYVIFPNSRKSGQQITKELIDQEGDILLKKFGGENKLLTCAQQS
jgi:hypothetical protein